MIGRLLWSSGEPKRDGVSSSEGPVLFLLAASTRNCQRNEYVWHMMGNNVSSDFMCIREYHLYNF